MSMVGGAWWMIFPRIMQNAHMTTTIGGRVMDMEHDYFIAKIKRDLGVAWSGEAERNVVEARKRGELDLPVSMEFVRGEEGETCCLALELFVVRQYDWQTWVRKCPVCKQNYVASGNMHEEDRIRLRRLRRKGLV